MAKLTRQLKYFINKKISEDSDWQGVEVVLSGHEVPGEGEHKIMEYIRLAKAQPDYDANVRHCLYGLDADLIMLGLLSHDPHFSLLREEVTFGRQALKKSKELEHQNFYLMHLCIVREYLELEFQELKEPGAIEFPFDMERVIDDFILMAFFVGNDFLPNLPNLHINEGALALMFKIYKSVLPKAGGYINERGLINMGRLKVLLDELQDVEYRFFESENADANWFKGKQMAKVDVMEKEKLEKRNKKGPLTINSSQKDVFKKVKQFVNNRSNDASNPKASLDLSPTLNAADRKFVEELAEDLHLQWKSIVDEQGNRHLRLDFPEKLDGDEDDEDIEDEEASLALLRVIKRYDNAKIVDITPDEVQQQSDKKYEEKFQGWKTKYYMTKFGWGLDNQEEMRKLTENYVQGLQWVLYYYYRGVASWPWFYGYHYSPMISDVKQGLNANVDFPLGQPFRPYQQLMGVLPDRSKTIVPTAYHDLMTNPDSPIIDFYPRDFELDMNGKKMEWEAVVKIPFIDEQRLLPAMRTREHLLSQEEKDRNEFGVSLKFTYSPDVEFTYPSSLVGVFPDIPRCHCIENIFDLPTIEGFDLHIGLMPGVKLGEAALAGFPSLKTLPFNGTLGFHGVNVFQQDSRNESMVITLQDPETRTKIEMVKTLLGRKVHVGYPFLSEAKVVRVSDEMFYYSLPQNKVGPPMAIPHGPQELGIWRKKAERIESVYSKRLGMMIGEVQALVHVDILKGLKKTDDGATIKEFAEIPGIETEYASQVIVENVVSPDKRFLEQDAVPVEQEFPIGMKAFFLGDFNYGRVLQVTGHSGNKIAIKISTAAAKVPEFGRQIVADADRHSPYSPSFSVAKVLGLNPLVLSKLTSSFQVNVDDSRINLGLNLKFEAKKLKVLGYSKRGQTGWEFSEKAIELVRLYMVKFPEFIAGVQRNSQGNAYNATDFYPASEAKARIKEIQSWLKEVESKSFEPVPLDADQLDSETVHRIEQAAEQVSQLDPADKCKIQRINGAPRNAILKPSDAEQRLNSQRFTLGDRVVYVADSGKVPIATRGTVVGKSRTARTILLDILFDIEFISGTTLGDRSSAFRGQTVPSWAVLNLTDRQVIAGNRATDNSNPPSQAIPLTVSGYGIPTGPNGQGQLKPASTPAPLRGSYLGAAGGPQTNGYRGGNGVPWGRGGLGFNNIQSGQQQLPIRQIHPQGHSPRGAPRGGAQQPNARWRGNLNAPSASRSSYIPIDRGGSEGVIQNNPAFKPQAYNNAPPPANLDSRGRGRGRGGPRGDAGRGRGRGRAGGAPRAQPAAVQQQG